MHVAKLSGVVEVEFAVVGEGDLDVGLVAE